jgi:hypothetical protein
VRIGEKYPSGKASARKFIEIFKLELKTVEFQEM